MIGKALRALRRVLRLGRSDVPGVALAGIVTPADLERAEGAMLRVPQVDVPLLHRFGPGVYLRTVCMPAGSQVIGHAHNTEHFNVVLTGRAEVSFEGRVEIIKAGDVFLSAAGVRKMFRVVEELTFMTIHPTNETDIETLESQLVTKSETWQAHARLAGKESPCLS